MKMLVPKRTIASLSKRKNCRKLALNLKNIFFQEVCNLPSQNEEIQKRNTQKQKFKFLVMTNTRNICYAQLCHF